MRVIKIDTRFWMVRHWFKWYIVRTPMDGKMLWTPLEKAMNGEKLYYRQKRGDDV